MNVLFLFQIALKDLLRPARLIVAALLAMIPAGIALAWRLSVGSRSFPSRTAYDALEPGLVFGFILVILTVMFSTNVISQEVEQKTIVYLLTRPVARWKILLSRWVAALVVIIATSWVASLLLALVTFGPSHIPDSALGRDMIILPVGALAYGAVFLLVATLIARPLLWGLMFVFGWESWVPSLPGAFKMGSLMAYLRVLAPHTSPESESVDIGSLLSSLNPTEISTRLAWVVLTTVIVIGLSGALWAFSTREYVPRDDSI